MYRLIATLPHATNPHVWFTLRYDMEWEEYTVTPMMYGRPDIAGRYHTDDEGDARTTMKLMTETYRPD